MGYSMDEFHINIPRELIAQYPPKKREDSRLLIIDLKEDKIIDEMFKNIDRYSKNTDCIVYNDARVIHARLYGEKTDTGGRVELLLIKKLNDFEWQSLVRPYKRVHLNTEISIKDKVKVKIVEKSGDGICILHFSEPINFEDLNNLGEIPLPKYIKRKPIPTIDNERYQTVFSSKYGAVASPTAGLHFTESIINKLKEKGVRFVPITLYVDWGTFKPIRVKDYRTHKIHSERFEISEESARIINECKRQGRRVICVGTTSVRTLESVADNKGNIRPGSGETDLYIYPGYRFKTVDALITNFHMPDSTLILLVAAFAGKEKIEEAYNHAIKERYRFFSYGDAMFIIKK